MQSSRLTLFIFAAALFSSHTGCQSSSDRKPPVLGARVLLFMNVGERVTIIGTAQYNSVWGPSIVGGDFELPVFTEKAWGPETTGKSIEVVGRLNNRSHFDKPPVRDVGEYWLSDATWSPAVTEKK